MNALTYTFVLCGQGDIYNIGATGAMFGCLYETEGGQLEGELLDKLGGGGADEAAVTHRNEVFRNAIKECFTDFKLQEMLL